MKKTLNINLGQQPFIIDEDAYLILDKYLSQLEVIFSDQDSTIVADIEHRFAEILLEKSSSNPIISVQQIEEGIQQIGTPESIGGAETEYHNESHHHSDPSTLYRSNDDKIVGGVATGIAHYFGIKEKFWVRLVFVLTIFTPLTLLYLLLWAVLPAQSLRDQPLQNNNLKTIVRTMAREIKNAMEDLKKSFVNA